MQTDSQSDWAAFAKCVDQPTAWWFPDDGAQPHPMARSLCRICPVADECLAGAVRRNETFGLWGGHGEQMIEVLRRHMVPGHDYGKACNCSFCLWVRGVAGNNTLVSRSGAGAKCGTLAKHGKGCRCVACREVAMHRDRFRWITKRADQLAGAVAVLPDRPGTCSAHETAGCRACLFEQADVA